MSVTTTEILYPSTIDNIDLAATVSYPTGGSNLPVIVVMHGFSQEVADFDNRALERFANGTYIDMTGVSGTFNQDETITGGTSGATATIDRVANSASMKRIVTANVSGTFQAAETITGGTSGATATIDTLTVTELFAVFVEMRGRGLSGGTPDAGGREIQDIIDAANHVLTAYASETDATQLHIVGYSGGGGNVFSAISKFPDFFASATALFGISDYGYDSTDGWYHTAPSDSYRDQMDEWIGASPSEVLDRYAARASVLGVTNYTGGELYIYHDSLDNIVPDEQSLNVIAAFDAVPLTNYENRISSPSDNPRWTHALPVSNQQVNLAEADFLGPASAKTHSAWTVPTSGTLQIVGYLTTKRFGILLGTGGTSDYGEITYNTSTDVYTVTINTAGNWWKLYLYGRTPSATVNITVNSVAYSATADADGVAYFDNIPLIEGAVAFRPRNSLQRRII